MGLNDDEASQATGIPKRTLREMIKLGVIKPDEGGKGRGNARVWPVDIADRLRIVSALIRSGVPAPRAVQLASDQDAVRQMIIDLEAGL